MSGSAQGSEPPDTTGIPEEEDLPAPAAERIGVGRDSVTAPPGVSYAAGTLHRLLLGDLNRDLWDLPITLPVLSLDSVAGGLTPTGVQDEERMLALLLRGGNGIPYRFRTLIEPAARAIPSPLRRTPLDEAIQDQIGAQFPLAPLIAVELLRAVDVPVVGARPFLMPDDPRLGKYGEAFAGRMGWLEVRLDSVPGERLGLDGAGVIVDTEELYGALRDSRRIRVDARSFLKARLIDVLLGDGQRGPDRWSWARFTEPDGRVRWQPVPESHDWALSRIDGVIPGLASIYFPSYVGFGADEPDIVGLTWSGQQMDRTLLTALSREDFLEVGRELQELLTDAVLDEALGTLPSPYQEVAREDLLSALRERRDRLTELADRFYRLLAGWVDLAGTDSSDAFLVSVVGDDRMRVEVVEGLDGGPAWLERTFDASETSEVRLYLYGGDDRVVVSGGRPLPIRLRIVGGAGDDQYTDDTDGSAILLYDDEGENRIGLGEEALVTDDVLLVQDSVRAGESIWDTRDWGRATVPLPDVRWDSDTGLYVGGGFDRYRFAFGARPYQSRFSLRVLNGADEDRWIVEATLERALGSGGWRGVLDLDVVTREPTWFFGFEEHDDPPGDEDDYRSFRSRIAAGAEIHFVADSTWSASAGATVTRDGAVEPGGLLLDELRPYGSEEFIDLGLHLGFEFDTRDRPVLPTRGFRGGVELSAHPATLDVREPFGGVQATLGAVHAFGPFALQSDLRGRLVGDRLFGDPPYHRRPSLGGYASLPGYVRHRFTGMSVVSWAGLARLEVAGFHVITDLRVGIHALATSGRVWSDGPAGDGWHRAQGGGVWIYAPSLDRVVSFTLVKGSGAPRGYLGVGSIF